MPRQTQRTTPWWKRLRKVKPNLDGEGRELLDPVPLTVPGPGDASLSIQDQIKRALRSEELSKHFYDKGIETFEEADDFDVEDDEDWRPFAEWESDFETPVEFPGQDDHGQETETTSGDEQKLPPSSSTTETETRPPSDERPTTEASDR